MNERHGELNVLNRKVEDNIHTSPRLFSLMGLHIIPVEDARCDIGRMGKNRFQGAMEVR
jgi:hypothetical protein